MSENRLVIEVDPTDTQLRNWCDAHGVRYQAVFTHWRDQERAAMTPSAAQAELPPRWMGGYEG